MMVLRHEWMGPMETWQAINAVRVVRTFSDQPIAEEDLERILNAARRTGSLVQFSAQNA